VAVVVTAVVAALVLVGPVPAAVRPAGAAQEAPAPDHWDKRIGPIAAKVERLRDLDFEHPVAVRFLSEADFEKQQRSKRSDLSKDEEKELQRSQSQLRALGLIGQDVDLFEAGNDIRSSDVLAYYDPATKRVTVKGTGPLDPTAKVTIAHELTHALQDQHFDLQKINRDGEKRHAQTAVRALVEGDARRVEDLYRNQLSDQDKALADAGADAQSAQATTDATAAAVPSALTALFQAPYAFGPSMVSVAESKVTGGIDGLFRNPPRNDAAFVTPSTLVDRPKFLDVARPQLAAGEKKVGKPDVFGSFLLYLLAGSRGDLTAAMKAADGWAGDSMVSFERGGQTCLRAGFVGHTAADTENIADALDGWAAGRTPEAATVARGDRGKDVTLTACDTGTAGPAAVREGDAIVTYAALRDTFYSVFLQQGAPSKVAKCAADDLLPSPQMAPLLSSPDTEPSRAQIDAIRATVTTLVQACARR
jgi:hypothetical protein